MRFRLFAAALALEAAITCWAPSVTRACTCSPAPIYDSLPMDGETDVPLNRALTIGGAFEPDSIVLEDARGLPVPFTLHVGPQPGCAGTQAELVPQEPLQPNSSYTLRVQGMYPHSAHESPSALTFTTGSALLPDEEPSVPSGEARVLFDVDPRQFMCGAGNEDVHACVRLDDWKDVEVLALRGDEVILRWVMGSESGSFALSQQPDCIELRRRTATGRRSAPKRLCGDALDARAFQPDDGDALGVLACNRDFVAEPVESEQPPVDSEQPPDAGEQTLSSDGPDADQEPDADEQTLSRGDPQEDEELDEAEQVPASADAGCALTSGAIGGPAQALFASCALLMAARRRRRQRG